jgi:putative tryptophan/tyrosine transport system substrate-binding protein
VASLARPGGNLTGLSNQARDLAGKRLELLREIIPDLRRLAILSNIETPIGALEVGEVQAAARTLDLEVLPLEIRRAEDIAPAFESLKGRAQAIYVVSEPLIASNRVRMNTLALGARLPTLRVRSRSSNQPSSISSSTSRPRRRSASTCRRHCSPAPTR